MNKPGQLNAQETERLNRRIRMTELTDQGQLRGNPVSEGVATAADRARFGTAIAGLKRKDPEAIERSFAKSMPGKPTPKVEKSGTPEK
jgi:hypothetical protein